MIATREANHPVIKLAALVLIRADFGSNLGPQNTPKAFFEDPLSELLKLGIFTSHNPRIRDIDSHYLVDKIVVQSSIIIKWGFSSCCKVWGRGFHFGG